MDMQCSLVVDQERGGKPITLIGKRFFEFIPTNGRYSCIGKSVIGWKLLRYKWHLLGHAFFTSNRFLFIPDKFGEDDIVGTIFIKIFTIHLERFLFAGTEFIIQSHIAS